jgi:hypothetical protein
MHSSCCFVSFVKKKGAGLDKSVDNIDLFFLKLSVWNKQAAQAHIKLNHIYT